VTVRYDPRQPEVIADPYPLFRRLQSDDPAHWSDVLGGWVLTRYDDVRMALGDARLSADRITPFMSRRGAQTTPGLAELARLVPLWAVFSDPPRHTRLRGLMNRAFTTRAVERLRPRVEAIIDDLLDRIRGRETFDVMRDFAYPLPITVIAELLGVAREERDHFKSWSDELAGFIGSALDTPDKYARAGRAMGAMAAYFHTLISERRREPRDDLMSVLIAAEERGDAMSEDELVATGVLLLFAGHETTTNLIGNAVLALLRHRGEVPRLHADPAAAVEEFLRYDGPTQAMVRIAGEDVGLHGRTIRRGDRIFTMIGAANRDPDQFPDPDRLDLQRQPNRHIAFGYGIHFCIGASLARLEAQLALPALLARFPALTLPVDQPRWLPSLVFRGVSSLPVRACG